MRLVFRTLFVGLAVLAGMISFATSTRAQTVFDVNFTLGQKSLEKDDWDPFEKQNGLAIASTFGGVDWPVRIAIDLLGTKDEQKIGLFNFDATVTELDFGLRKIWDGKKIRPFVGGGLAAIRGVVEGAGSDEDDANFGAWINGGVFWRLGKRLNLGFEVRISRAEISLFGIDQEAGGEFVGLLIGFGSPTQSP